jgi:hypothetical protein
MIEGGTDVTPVPMPEGYVASVRFGLEAELQKLLPTEPPPLGDVHPERHEKVLLTEALAPRPYTIARLVALALGFRDDLVLYQTRSEDTNAQALWSQVPVGIRLIGPVTDRLDEGALRAMIGHEIGHFMAHGPAEPVVRLLDRACARDVGPQFHTACHLAIEITADRFGLLGAQDLDSVIRLEIASELGVSVSGLGSREREHLEDCIRKVERKEVGFVAGRTHPSHAFRLYATWLFSRSDVYRDLVGDGPGDLAIAEVDDRIRSMCLEALPLALAEVRAKPSAPRREPAKRPARAVAATPRADAVLQRLRDAASVIHDAAVASIGPAAKRATPDEDDVYEGALDELDELEARFRRLEREQIASRVEAPEDLERRFRELEEAEERASGGSGPPES